MSKYFDKYYWQWFYVRYIKRVKCVLLGCDITWHRSAYMPMDYDPPSYCKRCEACHDVYGMETTDYPVIYPEETRIGTALMWLNR
jgi:hypothetical protein